ncbi:hypothetical protein KIPB_000448 [Kipferlia bialata]|uniref:Uncharacterized protein n=1 Tax=Kipferlia bialata TaxID=797122 RepID=A0A9K3GED1_9EUKA|nr:hypothetical protein KIPB_000448 [Kipferlia bialata]|eukprot:g448.t1
MERSTSIEKTKSEVKKNLKPFEHWLTFWADGLFFENKVSFGAFIAVDLAIILALIKISFPPLFCIVLACIATPLLKEGLVRSSARLFPQGYTPGHEGAGFDNIALVIATVMFHVRKEVSRMKTMREKKFGKYVIVAAVVAVCALFVTYILPLKALVILALIALEVVPVCYRYKIHEMAMEGAKKSMGPLMAKAKTASADKLAELKTSLANIKDRIPKQGAEKPVVKKSVPEPVAEEASEEEEQAPEPVASPESEPEVVVTPTPEVEEVPVPEAPKAEEFSEDDVADTIGSPSF